MNPLLGVGLLLGGLCALVVTVKEKAQLAEDAEFWALIKDKFYD